MDEKLIEFVRKCMKKYSDGVLERKIVGTNRRRVEKSRQVPTAHIEVTIILLSPSSNH